MSRSVLGKLLLAGIGLWAALGCTSRDFVKVSPDAALKDAKPEETPLDRASFFSTTSLYSIQIKLDNWDAMKDVMPSKMPKESNGGELIVSKFQNPEDQKPENDVACRSLSSEKESADLSPVFTSKKFGIQVRGDAVRGTPKSSYLVKIEDGSSEKLGLPKYLHLVSMYKDRSQMREALSYEIFRSAKVPSPAITYARLCIGARYYGLYAVMEHLDDGFLSTRLNIQESYGNAYEGAKSKLSNLRYLGDKDLAATYSKPYPLRGPERVPVYTDLVALFKAINAEAIPEEQKKAYFESKAYLDDLGGVFNYKTFLRWASANALISGWDNYWWSSKNYFLFNTGKKGLKENYFSFVPIDLDNTWGQTFYSVREGFIEESGKPGKYKADLTSAIVKPYKLDIIEHESVNNFVSLPLLKNLMQNPIARNYYLANIQRLMDMSFSEQWINEKKKKIWSTIRSSVYLEGYEPSSKSPKNESKGWAFQNAHTGRLFSNGEVAQAATDEDTGRENLKISKPEWSDLISPNVSAFVFYRRENVLKQLGELKPEPLSEETE